MLKEIKIIANNSIFNSYKHYKSLNIYDFLNNTDGYNYKNTNIYCIELIDDNDNKITISLDNNSIIYLPHHRGKSFNINSFDILDKALNVNHPITDKELDMLYDIDKINNNTYLKDYII
jgi:hypothetical protein